jgi:hypothetical protein
MTIAVCTKCGTEKFGAFNPCDKCGYEPASNRERAESIILSDHHYPRAQLAAFGKLIASGKKVAFDPDAVAEIEAGIERAEQDDGDDEEIESEEPVEEAGQERDGSATKSLSETTDEELQEYTHRISREGERDGSIHFYPDHLRHPEREQVTEPEEEEEEESGVRKKSRPNIQPFHLVAQIAPEEIRERWGHIPEAFRRCYLCNAPTAVVQCANLENVTFELASVLEEPFADPDHEALAQSLRGRFHHTIEFPVCEAHRHGARPQ